MTLEPSKQEFGEKLGVRGMLRTLNLSNMYGLQIIITK